MRRGPLVPSPRGAETAITMPGRQAPGSPLGRRLPPLQHAAARSSFFRPAPIRPRRRRGPARGPPRAARPFRDRGRPRGVARRGRRSDTAPRRAPPACSPREEPSTSVMSVRSMPASPPCAERAPSSTSPCRRGIGLKSPLARPVHSPSSVLVQECGRQAIAPQPQPLHGAVRGRHGRSVPPRLGRLPHPRLARDGRGVSVRCVHRIDHPERGGRAAGVGYLAFGDRDGARRAAGGRATGSRAGVHAVPPPLSACRHAGRRRPQVK